MLLLFFLFFDGFCCILVLLERSRGRGPNRGHFFQKVTWSPTHWKSFWCAVMVGKQTVIEHIVEICETFSNSSSYIHVLVQVWMKECGIAPRGPTLITSPVHLIDVMRFLHLPKLRCARRQRSSWWRDQRSVVRVFLYYPKLWICWMYSTHPAKAPPWRTGKVCCIWARHWARFIWRWWVVNRCSAPAQYFAVDQHEERVRGCLLCTWHVTNFV